MSVWMEYQQEQNGSKGWNGTFPFNFEKVQFD
jgi:hypothetical protein